MLGCHGIARMPFVGRFMAESQDTLQVEDLVHSDTSSSTVPDVSGLPHYAHVQSKPDL